MSGGHRPRSVIRYENWVFVPDQEPDAEPIMYAMQCAVCDEQSTASIDYTEGHAWALRHSGRNPSHHTYRELVTRPWRCWMRGW
ncbi:MULTISPECIES: DUF7848 domain-containing protein [Streptomyces]|uniref:DUF7848 domain-containing protein n=1 Tax=Streptomyces TaxID=1883 RepID=UPI0023EB6373|nr:hypothetical protein [Streptomyces sp. WMMB303]MDF4253903.1 hypothetical protein [Streptomyces sp. WMMB303]